MRADLKKKRLVELTLATWGGNPPRYALSVVRRRGARIGPVAQWAELRLGALCLGEIGPADGAVEPAVSRPGSPRSDRR